MCKIVGLMIVKNEADILNASLDHNSKLVDYIIAIDNGSTDGSYEILLNHDKVVKLNRYLGEYDERILVKKIMSMAKEINADWFIEIDADEFFSIKLRKVLESCSKEINTVTVNIEYKILDKCYKVNNNWTRCFRNIPRLFDFKSINKLHSGKNPIDRNKRVYLDSNLPVSHYQIRSYEQGINKYKNYLKLDKDFYYQKSYEHIKKIANMFNTGDFSGLQWKS